MFVKQQLNENSFEQCSDINCISNLIKVWFRDLPRHLLDSTNKEQVAAVDDVGSFTLLQVNSFSSFLVMSTCLFRMRQRDVC